ncbi:hypothetical protein PENSUB_2755 [Penicillium subrubescens]|uniref:Uncharacterized protein n=1 Tax=Penicillium subrubescens TaxID=1316194 RepID=A0A1Q5UGV4_9EURO|nr:hypothetical protein PENSUB_2755 [Penicillium subrubescens]
MAGRQWKDIKPRYLVQEEEDDERAVTGLVCLIVDLIGPHLACLPFPPLRSAGVKKLKDNHPTAQPGVETLSSLVSPKVLSRLHIPHAPGTIVLRDSDYLERRLHAPTGLPIRRQ